MKVFDRETPLDTMIKALCLLFLCNENVVHLSPIITKVQLVNLSPLQK